MATIKKNQNADVGKYSYKYVDIAKIHEYLESINSKYIQQIKRIENDDYVMTKRCFNDVWEEDWLQGAKVVEATLVGVKNPAQEQGSALTYARRYSLLMAYGLATEDDDAQCLSVSKEITLEDAKSYKFAFGKHKGKMLIDVFEDNSDYIDWLIDNSEDEYLLKCIELLSNEPFDKQKVETKTSDRLMLLVEYHKLLDATKTDEIALKKNYGVELVDNMTNEQLKDAIKIMKVKLERLNK